MKTLTVLRGAGNQPASIPVKIMPADVYGLIDCALTSGVPTQIRTYGHGSAVTLRAPVIPGWTFFEWIISDNGGSGPMGPGGS
ncbi:MAG: hypothetical protein JNG88_14975 [Phycisphaerales bacterium]|nr:hypothetical protein [Phycisphaerales bacterium]